MKIAVFHNLPPGGAKRTVYEQVKFLSQKHELHLFQLSHTNENFLPLYPFVKSIKTYPFSLSSNRLIADYQKFFILPQIHKQMASETNATVALIHADLYTQAPHILRYLKIPALYFCQEMLRIAYEPELAFTDSVSFPKKYYENLTRQMRKRIDKSNAQSASIILTNSDFTGAKVQKEFNRSTATCHLGVDLRVFYPTGQPKKNQVLFIDQKDKISGYDFVLQVLKLIPSKIRPKLKVLSFSKDTPSVPPQNIAKYYSESLATLCTSYNEPFGLASIESMACGTPVLAVDEGGYKETVINDKTGWLLPRDPKIFAQKIMELQFHPKIVKLQNFTWEKHNSIVESALCRLVFQ
ncbi:MAG: group 1 glycosyl transferase [Microgenomates group bacterium Gr01-1014_16]|nr:MAG: group 1 glycosyl transferase [Microgenomates group bacterium Gr01-1014_16]